MGSKPSFDKARGVSGGVFLERGKAATPSVSLVSSNNEVKEERAELNGNSREGVLGVVDGQELAGLERWAACTDEPIKIFESGSKLEVFRCVRRGITSVPDWCLFIAGPLELKLSGRGGAPSAFGLSSVP